MKPDKNCKRPNLSSKIFNDLTESTSTQPSSSKSLKLENYVEDFFVFGYGSLIWNPGFEYANEPIIGYACEHNRRFYQGNNNFRGTLEWPGRVATLLPSPGCKAWGLAYRVTNPKLVVEALEYLTQREMVSGDYEHLKINFHPVKPNIEDSKFPKDVHTEKCLCSNDSPMLQAITYVANTDNAQYLGPDSLDMESYQIAFAEGSAGPNEEYVRNIVEFHKSFVPNGLEEDLYLKEIIEYIDLFKSGNYDKLKYSNCFGDKKLSSQTD